MSCGEDINFIQSLLFPTKKKKKLTDSKVFEREKKSFCEFGGEKQSGGDKRTKGNERKEMKNRFCFPRGKNFDFIRFLNLITV